jgi:hypothetical protein
MKLKIGFFSLLLIGCLACGNDQEQHEDNGSNYDKESTSPVVGHPAEGHDINDTANSNGVPNNDGTTGRTTESNVPKDRSGKDSGKVGDSPR